MKFHPGVLAAVAAVSAAALAGCDQRPEQACGTLRPDGSRVDCTRHGFGFWPIFLGGGYRGGGPGVSSAGVSRGGFGATAAGHGGGGAGE